MAGAILGWLLHGLSLMILIHESPYNYGNLDDTLIKVASGQVFCHTVCSKRCSTECKSQSSFKSGLELGKSLSTKAELLLMAPARANPPSGTACHKSENCLSPSHCA